MYGSTRWNSFKEVAGFLDKHKWIIGQLTTDIASKSYCSAVTTNIINNGTFWSNIQTIYSILEPISKVVIYLQKNGSVSAVYYHWRQLWSMFDDIRPIPIRQQYTNYSNQINNNNVSSSNRNNNINTSRVIRRSGFFQSSSVRNVSNNNNVNITNSSESVSLNNIPASNNINGIGGISNSDNISAPIRVQQQSNASNNINNIRTSIRSINTPQLRKFVYNVIKQKWQLIECDVHYAAFILDPRFRDEPISIDDYKRAENFLKKRAGSDWSEYHPYLTDFRLKNNDFGHPTFVIDLNKDPLVPWRWISMFPKYNKFANFVLKVLKIPPGIGAVERSFSPVRRIHTWQRSSMQSDTVDDLIYVYVNLRFLGEI